MLPSFSLATPLLEKFNTGLDPAALAELAAVPVTVRDVGRDGELLREGERPAHCLLLIEGFACRYRTLPDGRRQIVSFHVPLDFIDLHGLVLGRLDHGVATLAPSRVGVIDHAALAGVLRNEAITRLLWRESLVDAAIHREWIVNVGRRSAYQRIAHIFCELVTRLQAVGLSRDGVCDLPITQSELADATGLSTVHVNRVIQELRREGLIALRSRSFAALDWEGLKTAAEIEPSFLALLSNRHRPPWE